MRRKFFSCLLQDETKIPVVSTALKTKLTLEFWGFVVSQKKKNGYELSQMN